MAMCRRLNHSTNSHKLKWIGGEGATTCNLSNSAPSGRRDNFAAFGVEEMLDHFTRVFIILNDQDAGFFFGSLGIAGTPTISCDLNPRRA